MDQEEWFDQGFKSKTPEELETFLDNENLRPATWETQFLTELLHKIYYYGAHRPNEIYWGKVHVLLRRITGKLLPEEIHHWSHHYTSFLWMGPPEVVCETIRNLETWGYPTCREEGPSDRQVSDIFFRIACLDDQEPNKDARLQLIGDFLIRRNLATQASLDQLRDCGAVVLATRQGDRARVQELLKRPWVRQRMDPTPIGDDFLNSIDEDLPDALREAVIHHPEIMPDLLAAGWDTSQVVDRIRALVQEDDAAAFGKTFSVRMGRLIESEPEKRIQVTKRVITAYFRTNPAFSAMSHLDPLLKILDEANELQPFIYTLFDDYHRAQADYWRTLDEHVDNEEKAQCWNRRFEVSGHHILARTLPLVSLRMCTPEYDNQMDDYVQMRTFLRIDSVPSDTYLRLDEAVADVLRRTNDPSYTPTADERRHVLTLMATFSDTDLLKNVSAHVLNRWMRSEETLIEAGAARLIPLFQKVPPMDALLWRDPDPDAPASWSTLPMDVAETILVKAGYLRDRSKPQQTLM